MSRSRVKIKRGQSGGPVLKYGLQQPGWSVERGKQDSTALATLRIEKNPESDIQGSYGW